MGKRLIEEYIELVKSRLPKSIADDVSSEIESYLEAAAADIGQGNITEDSAKAAIAAFGSPADVAEEYIETLADSEKMEVRTAVTDTYFDAITNNVKTKTNLIIGFGHIIILPLSLLLYDTPLLFQLLIWGGFFVFILFLVTVGFTNRMLRRRFNRNEETFSNGNSVLPHRQGASISIEIVFLIIILVICMVGFGSFEEWVISLARSWRTYHMVYSVSVLGLIGIAFLGIAVSVRLIGDVLEFINEYDRISYACIIASGLFIALTYGFAITSIFVGQTILGVTGVVVLLLGIPVLGLISLNTAIYDTKRSYSLYRHENIFKKRQ